MEITLKSRFASDGNVDEFDTRQIKKALNRVGCYAPPEKLGITGIPDQAVFDGLRQFQQAQGLTVTGIAKPGDETIAALNRACAKPPTGSYIWRSVNDSKARAAHATFNGTVRSWSDAPDPGEDYNCRCWAEEVPKQDVPIYDPPIEPVYPEALLLPVAAGRLYTAWKLWKEIKHSEWTLGKFKSATKWGNQIKNRNWTPEQITETIRYGEKFPAPNNVNPSNPAIRYEYKGRGVIRDEKTKEILQITRPDFKRSEIKVTK